MEKTARNKGIEIILGISFIVLGIISLNRPVSTLGILVIWFGVLSIARGLANVIGLGIFSGKGSRGLSIFIGILDIIIGVIFVSNIIKGAFWLGFIFAFWFLVECVGNLFLTARFSNKQGLAKVGILLLDIMCFIIAILLLLNPIIVTMTLPILIGIFAILFGTIQLFQGLIN